MKQKLLGLIILDIIHAAKNPSLSGGAKAGWICVLWFLNIFDHLVKDIPAADKGFRMLFSARVFPGYALKVAWRRADRGGNWYYSEELDREGWLCPALFKYSKEAPKEIYVKAERKNS